MLNKPVDEIVMEKGRVVGVKSEGEVPYSLIIINHLIINAQNIRIRLEQHRTSQRNHNKYTESLSVPFHILIGPVKYLNTFEY